MYILLTGNVVSEIIPDTDPIFPGVPISERFPETFVAQLLHVDDGTAVEPNWLHLDDGTFAPPIVPEPDGPIDTFEEYLDAAKDARIAQSKEDLATYLENHPLQWTDGEYYAITAEKQNQLTSKIMAATMAQTLSTDYALTWNSTGEVCKEWALTDLYALAFAIDARVTALVSYQQTQEVAMKNATTLDELNSIEVDYDTVQ